MTTTVLVTDPAYTHSVSAIQCLGKAGCRVVTVASGKKSLRTLGVYSRYCSAAKVVSDYKFEKKHIADLIDFCKEQKVDVVLPISFPACSLYSKFCGEFQKSGIAIPITAWEDGMNIGCSKYLTFKFAQSINFPIPKTHFYQTDDSIESIKKCLSYPMVIKGLEGANVRYANNDAELENCLEHLSKDPSGGDLIIQEYIEGSAHGYYALCNNGKVLCQFMHKRIKEYPITGGPSVIAQSFYDQRLESLGRRFVSSLRWTGVCMVEFKQDKRDGKYKLIEMNPKFWGSLILSIKCGINFPLYAVKMALGEDFEPVLNYRQNLICHWPFPGEISLVAGFPLELFKILRIILSNKNTISLSFSDPIPSMFEIFIGIGSVLKRAWQGRLRYPYGKPILP